MNILESIHQLPNIEKIKAMELLWEDLTINAQSYLSPPWHETELKKTESRFNNEQEELVDWNKAKQTLKTELQQ